MDVLNSAPEGAGWVCLRAGPWRVPAGLADATDTRAARLGGWFREQPLPGTPVCCGALSAGRSVGGARLGSEQRV